MRLTRYKSYHAASCIVLVSTESMTKICNDKTTRDSASEFQSYRPHTIHHSKRTTARADGNLPSNCWRMEPCPGNSRGQSCLNSRARQSRQCRPVPVCYEALLRAVIVIAHKIRWMRQLRTNDCYCSVPVAIMKRTKSRPASSKSTGWSPQKGTAARASSADIQANYKDLLMNVNDP